MSSFIIPMASLPSISSLPSIQSGSNAQNAGNSGAPFAQLLQQAIENVGETQGASAQNRVGLALGTNDDMHTGAIASVKTSAAINFTSSLASAAIRSYNEIMRMQV